MAIQWMHDVFVVIPRFASQVPVPVSIKDVKSERADRATERNITVTRPLMQPLWDIDPGSIELEAYGRTAAILDGCKLSPQERDGCSWSMNQAFSFQCADLLARSFVDLWMRWSELEVF